MTFTLPPLPYAPDGLAPVLSAETLAFHHGKHHKGYVEKLNELVKGTVFERSSLEDIVRSSSGTIYNNAAQHYNHSFYWNCMNPAKPSLTDAKFKSALEKEFSSIDGFREQFAKKAETIFGTGWCWLVRNKSGGLAIVQAQDADCPLIEGDAPLLTCDVWEHAYYIDYRNERGKYIKAFLDIVDWDFVGARFRSDSPWTAGQT